MKYFFVLICAIAAYGCVATKYYVPEGYKACRNDWDCDPREYCGFVKVDSYAVCRR